MQSNGMSLTLFTITVTTAGKSKAVYVVNIAVVAGAYDVTGAFTVDAGAIALDHGGAVVIEDAEIPVKPTLGELMVDAAEPFAFDDGTETVLVNAIPGLSYELLSQVVPDGADLADDGWEAVGEPVMATGPSLELTEAAPGEGRAYYIIRVYR